MKLNELLSETEYDALRYDLEEGPVWDKVKAGAKIAGLAAGLMGVLGAVNHAKAEKWVDNPQQDRLEYYRDDGQGVWTKKHDEQGKPLTQDQITQNIEQALKQLPPMGQQSSGGQQQAPNYGIQTMPPVPPQFVLVAPARPMPYGYAARYSYAPPSIVFNLGGGGHHNNSGLRGGYNARGRR